MKVMVLGDLHGDTAAGINAIRKAKELGIAHIVQVGDFGIFPKYRDMITYLDDLNSALRVRDVNLYFLDGNHDDADFVMAIGQMGYRDDRGRIPLRSNLSYLPRGCQWTWNHKRFMAVGGAVSVDREWRQIQERNRGPRTLWFPNEQLDPALLNAIVQPFANGTAKPVDYLFTHDSPTNAPFGARIKEDADSQAHRQRMDILGREVKPSLWFHGHFHTRYDGYDFPAYESHTTVYGLECNPKGMQGYGTGSWWGVLDTETDMFRYGPDYEQLTVRPEDSIIDDDF